MSYKKHSFSLDAETLQQFQSVIYWERGKQSKVLKSLMASHVEQFISNPDNKKFVKGGKVKAAPAQ